MYKFKFASCCCSISHIASMDYSATRVCSFENSDYPRNEKDKRKRTEKVRRKGRHEF